MGDLVGEGLPVLVGVEGSPVGDEAGDMGDGGDVADPAVEVADGFLSKGVGFESGGGGPVVDGEGGGFDEVGVAAVDEEVDPGIGAIEGVSGGGGHDDELGCDREECVRVVGVNDTDPELGGGMHGDTCGHALGLIRVACHVPVVGHECGVASNFAWLGGNRGDRARCFHGFWLDEVAAALGVGIDEDGFVCVVLAKGISQVGGHGGGPDATDGAGNDDDLVPVGNGVTGWKGPGGCAVLADGPPLFPRWNGNPEFHLAGKGFGGADGVVHDDGSRVVIGLDVQGSGLIPVSDGDGGVMNAGAHTCRHRRSPYFVKGMGLTGEPLTRTSQCR